MSFIASRLPFHHERLSAVRDVWPRTYHRRCEPRRKNSGHHWKITKSIAAWSVVASTLLVIGCQVEDRATQVTGGNAKRGKMILAYYGCGGCHTIPGVPGARATVGPSLEHIAARVYLAGELRNTPDTMVRWLRHPQQLRPGSAMPELGMHTIDARDIAAFLYTLR